MKSHFAAVLILTAILCSSCASQPPKLTGPYLGQTPPGSTPEVFAPGIVSNSSIQGKLTMSPAGDEIVWSQRISTDRSFWRIVRSNNTWGTPELIPFSTEYINMEPSFSPDGKRLYFVSKRPPPGTDEPSETADIWYSTRHNNGWGEPEYLSSSVNSRDVEVQPFMGSNGNFYFVRRPADIYVSKFDGNTFSVPEVLPSVINSQRVSGPCPSPDGRFLLLHSNTADTTGGFDIYITFRNTPDGWGPLIKLDPPINTAADETNPTLSPDGRYMFFRRSDGEIYWVRFPAIMR